MSTGLVRLGGLVAILGGALGMLLFPILTYLWASESAVYGYFGRAYFLVFLGCLSGLAGLYTRRRTDLGSLWASRPETEGWVIVLMLIGLVLSLVGNVLEYWGGKPGGEFTTTQVKGFSLEIAGLVLVLSVPHIPSGTMLLFCCAWSVLGYLLLTRKVRSAKQP